MTYILLNWCIILQSPSINVHSVNVFSITAQRFLYTKIRLVCWNILNFNHSNWELIFYIVTDVQIRHTNLGFPVYHNKQSLACIYICIFRLCTRFFFYKKRKIFRNYQVITASSSSFCKNVLKSCSLEIFYAYFHYILFFFNVSFYFVDSLFRKLNSAAKNGLHKKNEKNMTKSFFFLNSRNRPH